MADDLIGQTIGQYLIVEPLGRGGMAVVYKAYQATLDRHVAIKILPDSLARGEGNFLARFRREARAAARLDHPNILPIHDFGEHEGTPFIVMPLIEGGALKHRIGSPIPVDRCLAICSQVAQALDYAHSKGVIHRDVKPANVLLAAGDRALLADFGLAKLVGTGSALTGNATRLGTPEYMSPEQCRGIVVDARTDVYSLGVMLFEILAGVAPYRADTPLAVLFKQISDPVPSLRPFNPAVTSAIDEVVQKALAKDPEDRFDTAGEFAAMLEAATRPGAGAVSFAAATAPTLDLDQIYRQIQASMAASDWETAISRGAQLRALAPAYRDAGFLMERCREELKERRRRDSEGAEPALEGEEETDRTPAVETLPAFRGNDVSALFDSDPRQIGRGPDSPQTQGASRDAGAATMLTPAGIPVGRPQPRQNRFPSRLAAAAIGLVLLGVGGVVVGRGLLGAMDEGAGRAAGPSPAAVIAPPATPDTAARVKACADGLNQAEEALAGGVLGLAQTLFVQVGQDCSEAPVEPRLVGVRLLIAARNAQENGDWIGAFGPIRQLVDADPQFPGGNAALFGALVGAGQAALADGLGARAEELCAEALTIQPQSASALQCLAAAQPTATATALPPTATAVPAAPATARPTTPPVFVPPPTPVPTAPLAPQPTATKPAFAPPGG